MKLRPSYEKKFLAFWAKHVLCYFLSLLMIIQSAGISQALAQTLPGVSNPTPTVRRSALATPTPTPKTGVENRGKPKGPGSFAKMGEYLNYLIVLAGAFAGVAILKNCRNPLPWKSGFGSLPPSVLMFEAGMGVYILAEIYGMIKYKEASDKKLTIDHDKAANENSYQGQAQEMKKAQGVTDEAAKAAMIKYTIQQAASVLVLGAAALSYFEIGKAEAAEEAAEAGLLTSFVAQATCASNSSEVARATTNAARLEAMDKILTAETTGLSAETKANNAKNFVENYMVGIFDGKLSADVTAALQERHLKRLEKRVAALSSAKNQIATATSSSTARQAGGPTAASTVAACIATCSAASSAVKACAVAMPSLDDPLSSELCKGIVPAASETAKAGFTTLKTSILTALNNPNQSNAAKEVLLDLMYPVAAGLTFYNDPASVNGEIKCANDMPKMVPWQGVPAAEMSYTMLCAGLIDDFSAYSHPMIKELDTYAFNRYTGNQNLDYFPTQLLLSGVLETTNKKSIKTLTIEEQVISEFKNIAKLVSNTLVNSAEAGKNNMLTLGLAAAGGIGGGLIATYGPIAGTINTMAVPKGRAIWFLVFGLLMEIVSLSTLNASQSLAKDAGKFKKLAQELQNLEVEDYEDDGAKAGGATVAGGIRYAGGAPSRYTALNKTICFTGPVDNRVVDIKCACRANSSCTDKTLTTPKVLAAFANNFPGGFAQAVGDSHKLDKALSNGDVKGALSAAQAISARRAFFQKALDAEIKKQNDKLASKGLPTLDLKKTANDLATAIGNPVKGNLSASLSPSYLNSADSLNGSNNKNNSGSDSSGPHIQSRNPYETGGGTPSLGNRFGQSQIQDSSDEATKAALAQSEQEAMNKNYDYGKVQEDIHNDESVSLFKVISVRYLKTAYKEVFGEGEEVVSEKEKTPVDSSVKGPAPATEVPSSMEDTVQGPEEIIMPNNIEVKVEDKKTQPASN